MTHYPYGFTFDELPTQAKFPYNDILKLYEVKYDATVAVWDVWPNKSERPKWRSRALWFWEVVRGAIWQANKFLCTKKGHGDTASWPGEACEDIPYHHTEHLCRDCGHGWRIRR